MKYMSRKFMAIAIGQAVRCGGARYEITHLVSVNSVMARNLETGKDERLRVESLTPPDSGDGALESPSGERDITQYSESEWAKAQQRFAAIKPLLDDPIHTRADAEAAAAQAGVHVATVYHWLKLYQSAGHVSALVPEKRGRKTGTRLLTEAQEAVIDSAIEDVYLHKQRHSKKDVIEEVKQRCRLAKIAKPHPNTVRNRISALDPALVLRRRGQRDKAKRYEAFPGHFPGADFPLAVVQIDHTPGDVMLVDEDHRLPIGRPWITLAIDVYSRMVVGLYISLEAPNAAAVGMVLAQAICPKREYLASLGVDGDWPVWGVMATAHSDNGKDLRSESIAKACQDYAIDMQWRPVTKPHYGAHIERLMGTAATELHKLPGTTFSNTDERKGYDSEKEAVMTLKEFERQVVDFIVNIYHQRRHDGIGMPPIRKWTLGIVGDEHTPGAGVPPIPENPVRVQIDFMPYEERTVQQYGVQIDHIRYYGPELDPYVNRADEEDPKSKRKFLFRRHPKDISKLYFLDPKDNIYVDIPYMNIGQPAISQWELRKVTRQLKAEGIKDIDEHRIFEAVKRMRLRVARATGKTKLARRQAAQQPKSKLPKPHAVATGSRSNALQPAAPLETDPFAMPIKPFDEVSLVR